MEVMIWHVLQIVLSGVMIWIFNVIWFKPKRIQYVLSRQGIRGPKPHFFYGNLQEMQNIQVQIQMDTQNSAISHASWCLSIFPYLHHWAQHYGKVYKYSTGNKQHLYITEPEVVKSLNFHKSLEIGKPKYLSKAMEPMLGNGIIRANGSLWAHQRKLIAPVFFLQKAKQHLGIMKESSIEMIRKWEKEVEKGGGIADITVDKDLKSLSGDVISKACFGSSYSQGKQIFAKMEALQDAMSNPTILFGLSNLRFLPSKSNKEVWRLQKEVKSLILEVVKRRRESDKSENDLLEALLECDKGKDDSEKYIVDNCKNIYFAGHDTTANAASWILMLLSLYPDWQHRLRQEIIDISAGNLHDCLLDLDNLRLFKTMTMVIQESLRLYGPAVITSREVFSDIKLGDLTVPKGTNIWIPMISLHRDPENWGSDSNEFKPERFANGISEACKHPQAYIPFGLGTRLCVGQTFAMLELKILLSLILSNFTFSLSPDYCHSPVYRMLLKPKHGIKLLVKKL
ncbi:Cytochrome P450 714A1 [Euphorbia peplus]|nr:Cytochrome P450 714A1 [Euphorbia peplus]